MTIFLLPARPTLGPRDRKILAKNKDLRPCDAQSHRDAVTKTTPSRRHPHRRPIAISLAARARRDMHLAENDVAERTAGGF